MRCPKNGWPAWLHIRRNWTASQPARRRKRHFSSRCAEVIGEYALPIQLFRDLLDAFAQDVVKKRYADYPELLDYCRRSANPVGRLVLHLFGRTEPRASRHNPTASARRCN